ncbi:GIY-YIG nuclease family protein [bacterium]|nr:GIY-YIG nuclease family protein [bacterium]MBU1959104.1 GIY-YIG nuclease family protein [bacterium]
MAKFTLDDILNNDPLGLLGEVKAKNPILTADDRLIASFEEINSFVEREGYEPTKSDNMQERRLYSRLQGIREDVNKSESLNAYDRFNLLEILAIESIDDILNNDILGIFEEDAEDIFKLKHVPKIDKNRADADFVAQRKVCENFEAYEALFQACQADLKVGSRSMGKFNEKHLSAGTFFILKGVMGYLEKIIDAKKDKNSKVDGRTRCIFENGTYSNMLLRSLAKGLYEDGYLISQHQDRIFENDQSYGFIYVLKSLSHDDRIATKKNLYKIGFSKEDVHKRVANAINEPTYLMSAVSIISIYQCFNMNPQKLEQLLHKFFGKSCLDIEIFDKDGNSHTTREWFIAPLEVIDEVIDLIISGKVIYYLYDAKNESIVKRRE